MPKVNNYMKGQMKKLKEQGYSIEKIAKFLRVSDHTVKYHMNPTYRKQHSLASKRQRKNLSPEKRKEDAKQHRKRYREDPEYRKRILQNNLRSRRKKQGYMERPKKCVRCGLKIERWKDLEQLTIQSKDAKEFLGVKGSKTLSMHKACWKKVPKREKRILEGNNFTSQCLNIRNEIWLRLTEEGDFLWGTMFSDIPEVDRRLQEMKRKDRLSPEDLETLKKLLNEMGEENA